MMPETILKGLHHLNIDDVKILLLGCFRSTAFRRVRRDWVVIWSPYLISAWWLRDFNGLPARWGCVRPNATKHTVSCRPGVKQNDVTASQVIRLLPFAKPDTQGALQEAENDVMERFCRCHLRSDTQCVPASYKEGTSTGKKLAASESRIVPGWIRVKGLSASEYFRPHLFEGRWT